MHGKACWLIAYVLVVTLHPSFSSIDPFSVTLSHPTPPSYVVFLSLALACAVVVLVCTHSHCYPRPILRPLYRATQHIHYRELDYMSIVPDSYMEQTHNQSTCIPKVWPYNMGGRIEDILSPRFTPLVSSIV